MPSPPATHNDPLLWTLEEIGRLVSQRGHAAETLSNLVQLIQRRFGTDVCSVYLLEPDRANLVLAATIGLRQESVGRIRMRLSEGLAGLVAEQLAPQCVADAATHPRFKYFADAGEDPYRSFLGVPVVDRGLLQGVLVVQTTESRVFSDEDVRMLLTAGMQLAPIVSEARTLGQFVAPAHQRLKALSENLWWSWDADTTALFRELDPVAWREIGHNPVALLEQMPIAHLEERASQLALHSRINNAYRRMQEYLGSRHTWGGRHAGVLGARPVAYFSAEFGLHESLPIYSGGLGILAGDHIKAASDLGVPLVGIGLCYDQGYFRQRLDHAGWQHEDYLDLEHRVLPIRPAEVGGRPVMVSIETRTGTIVARVWRVAVGRNALLLLDSDVEGNRPEDRQLTARLYGGDERIRIRQELLLGVGGVRALDALGILPGVLHLNEGHSAFAALERTMRRMTVEGIGVADALERVASEVVFTTHTPVPAGHDWFSPALVEEHLGPLREALGLSEHDLMALGRTNPSDENEGFCMTVLALKMSSRANAVSSLHGRVSRAMWRTLVRPYSRAPIGHITNGVHVHTWLAPQMRQVYDRHLGPTWPARAGEPEFWDRVDAIDDGELWETHLTLKKQLIEVARLLASRQAAKRSESADLVDAAPSRAELRRVDDRLRATIRHLQASQPRAARHRTAGRARQQRPDADPVRLRRQVAPPRRTRQDRPSRNRTPDPRPALSREDRLHRGLRHQHRPPPRAGRRRLAELPAAPARSLRHERPESRAERGVELFRARRLVGGGVRRVERFRDRHGRKPYVAGAARRTGCRRADARAA